MKDLLLAMRSGLLWQLLRLGTVMLLVFVLSALLGAVLVMVKDPPAAIPPSPSTLAAVSIELAPSLSTAGGSAMLAQPLFWGSRRPEAPIAPVAQVVPVSGEDVLDSVRLLGMFSAGETGGVILSVAGQRQRLMIGQGLEQWKLQGITADGAQFVSVDDDSSERVLPLEHADVGQTK